jgi:hypothetical protein
MLVFFSGRRLKPEGWQQFREAWGPSGDEMKKELPEGAVVIYHARNLKDPDEVISFGIFEGDPGDRDKVRGDEEEELKRQDAMAKSVHDVPLEGVYEVIEEIRP